MWPDSRLPDLFAIDLPIIQAPMAGFQLLAVGIGPFLQTLLFKSANQVVFRGHILRQFRDTQK
jgi:hypothetical protein